MKGSDFPQGDERQFLLVLRKFCTRMNCFSEHNPDPMMRSHTQWRMTVDPFESL